VENTNMPNIQRALPIIRQLAQEVGTAPDLAERATRGALALLPREILGLSMVQPSIIGLNLAIAHRSTINDGTLSWDRGMEEIGPDLLTLAGCEKEMRERILSETRTTLARRHRTPLEESLLRLLKGAATIATQDSTVLSVRVASLFRERQNREVEQWQPPSGARVRSGSTEIAVLAGPDGEIAAVELRLYHPNEEECWRLPVSLGAGLVEQFKTL
jgi:hypothetical protein